MTEQTNTIVTATAPLRVTHISDPMEYDTIYFEEGGYIEIKVGTQFTIHNIKRLEYPQAGFAPSSACDASKDSLDPTGYDIIILPDDGENGESAASGDNGANGQNGRDGADGLIFQDGQDGQNGQNGQRGLNGEDGQSGGNGATLGEFTLTIENSELDINILNRGASGGDGGNGGNGGHGGAGGKAGVAGEGETAGVAGTNGTTGLGGQGGKGGDGGDAGQGTHVDVHWYSETNQVTFKNERGNAGMAGKGGANGQPEAQPKTKPFLRTKTTANDGNHGLPGTLGSVNIITREPKDQKKKE